jgi:hypothetical protein
VGRRDFNETRGRELTSQPRRRGRTRRLGTSLLRPRLRADEGGGSPGSPSVAMGVVMGLRMGGSLAGVVAARPREAARQLLRMGRDRVAVSMIVDL